MRRDFRKGESLTEYALLIAIVVGGMIGVQHYVKRAIEGRSGSALAGGEIAGAAVYVPGLTEASMTTTATSSQTDVFTREANALDPDVEIITIVSEAVKEQAVTGTKRVDEQPFWRLYD